MLRLFNTINASKYEQQLSMPTKKFSRFEPRHVRDPIAEECVAPPQPQQRASIPVAAYRPVSLANKKPRPVFDEAAHLHSDARVSIAVLRRALPQRFAGMT
ncbi:hypothetical protein ACOTTU_13535 [Roseobacter sp. EG26]|uniref:hypothetical protein n=1 Tax=Roseobacter sp. EG26 TaxID=3412477 RepID=UPI002631E119|nr:hypothetical protein [uncultured Roseobacter sp.]